MLITWCDLTYYEVCGEYSNSAPLRDFYDTYYNAIDRLNQDYNMFFVLRNWHDATQWGLHSAIFYFLNSVHALWEEHRVLYAFHHAGRRQSAAKAVEGKSLPQFILDCALALAAQWKERK